MTLKMTQTWMILKVNQTHESDKEKFAFKDLIALTMPLVREKTEKLANKFLTNENLVEKCIYST